MRYLALTVVIFLMSSTPAPAESPRVTDATRDIVSRKIPSASARFGRFAPAFTPSGGLLAKLRKHRAMPLWQLIDSRDRELFIGVDRDGTVGFHYSFGR